ncbi:MAG: DHA2 family efflux MFS transporter permease subunit [Streptosporangiales bacterium]|nr:DHA2 family efflux MFS transporter permease subunit [Streptosporangiales bacterium]
MSALLTPRDIVIPEGAAGRSRRLVVLLICSSSLFLAYLDTTILNVALPTIQRDLHTGLAALQWVADVYLLVLSALLILAGSTADRIGRKRLFMVGLIWFSAGSLLCSFAPNVESLVVLRMLQAVGGSMLTPVSLSIVRNVFTDPKERAQALGIWSGIFGVASACGPVVGGILVSEVGWRSVFWVNVPVGIVMLLAARRYVPDSKAPRARRIDVPGQLLMIVFLGTLTYAVIEGPGWGWASPAILVLFTVAVVSLAAFVILERRHPEPLLDPRFFRSPPFTGASVIAVLAFLVMAGFLFVATLYLQQVRGDSPLRAGLSLLPATAMIAVWAPVAGQLNGRFGPRIPLVLGGVFMTAGAAVLTGLSASTSYGVLALGFALLGAGLGLVNPPITNTGVSGMPPAQAGVAGAVISATRQLGQVLGVAVMGAMLSVGAVSGSPVLSAAAGRTFAVATRAPWWLAVACGALIALTGWITTSVKARETARAVAEAS